MFINTDINCKFVSVQAVNRTINRPRLQEAGPNTPVPAGEELAAWRRTDGLNIVILQPHALRRQFVQSGRLDVGVVVANVVEALLQEESWVTCCRLFK